MPVASMKGSGEQTGSQVSGVRIQSNEKMGIAVLFVFVVSLGRALDEFFFTVPSIRVIRFSFYWLLISDT